jgi:ubiquitin C-terminal hydrolase
MDFSKYIEKGYSGLVNLGNTCFLNACIQALNHTYELHDCFHKHSVKKNIKENDDAEILKQWVELTDVMLKANSIISPNKFVHNVHRISMLKNKELFTGFTQNDMPEFLLFIIECFHNGISRETSIKIKGTTQNSTDVMAYKCYEMLKETYKKEYSEIMDLFYGIYVSEVLSMDGEIVHSTNPESFFILDIPIPQTPSCSIYECFDLFTKTEHLVDENAWFNEKTNQKENIQKRMCFWSFPNILVITLKRFSPDGRYKLNQHIDFPLENLDLSKYVKGYNPSTYKYDLYAVCNHMGNVYGGHYTACVKNADGIWLHFNDQIIEKIENPQVVVSHLAYCLFYRKIKL